MAELKGACIFGQSGGPTSVINASAAGVFKEAMRHRCITEIYGLAYGIQGVLREEFYDMRKETPGALELLKTTPSSALGSVRYKLEDVKEGADYKRILEVFKKYNIRYFFYNGGNDSMDTCNKINGYLKAVKYDCRVIGIPKTIDNDIQNTDHCPGFGSAAKYIATSAMEIYHDTKAYDRGRITILEIMGRNAGWLTASAALASYKGCGPDLIYLPEVEFDISKFVKETDLLYSKNKNVIAAVSEGIKDKSGRYIAEYGSDFPDSKKDSFGHIQLGGLAPVLVKALKNKTDAPVRYIEYSLLQRCAAHCASKTDVDEAYLAGQMAVRSAVEGVSGYMIGFEREDGPEYRCRIKFVDLKEVANVEKKIPKEWINKECNGINRSFVEYALPLIQGESYPPAEGGLPRFAKLNKVPGNQIG